MAAGAAERSPSRAPCESHASESAAADASAMSSAAASATAVSKALPRGSMTVPLPRIEEAEDREEAEEKLDWGRGLWITVPPPPPPVTGVETIVAEQIEEKDEFVQLIRGSRAIEPASEPSSDDHGQGEQ